MYGTIFSDPERDQLTTNEQTVTLYRTVSNYFWTYEKTGVLGFKVLLRKQKLKFFLEVYHYIFRSTSMVCYVSVGHVRATEALGAIVAVITAEQGRHSRGSGNSRSVPATSVLFLGQQEEPEKTLQARRWTHLV